jgi:CO dehydrogenase/acetyl-CoA synthase beta subunit
MSIKEAIERLSQLRSSVGEDIEVFFDCPKCKESFTPSHIATVAIHFESKK